MNAETFIPDSTYVDVPSAYGHDSFLVEYGPVARLVKAAAGGPW